MSLTGGPWNSTMHRDSIACDANCIFGRWHSSLVPSVICVCLFRMRCHYLVHNCRPLSNCLSLFLSVCLYLSTYVCFHMCLYLALTNSLFLFLALCLSVCLSLDADCIGHWPLYYCSKGLWLLHRISNNLHLLTIPTDENKVWLQIWTDDNRVILTAIEFNSNGSHG